MIKAADGRPEMKLIRLLQEHVWIWNSFISKYTWVFQKEIVDGRYRT